jgi:hypothetical protein
MRYLLKCLAFLTKWLAQQRDCGGSNAESATEDTLPALGCRRGVWGVVASERAHEEGPIVSQGTIEVDLQYGPYIAADWKWSALAPGGRCAYSVAGTVEVSRQCPHHRTDAPILRTFVE